jgi:hypothetical protein
MIETQGVPIIIGVSGHRDLPAFNESAEQPQLNVELEAKRALTYWLDKLIDTSIPVWLFTGCAQGADLVVVRAAESLNEEGDYKGRIRIFPILAMPAENLEQDFNVKTDSGYGLDYFKDTVKKYSSDVIVMKHPFKGKSCNEEYELAKKDIDYGCARNRLYLTQSCFVAKYSNVLLALWNGESEQAALTGNTTPMISGGTSDAVHYAMNQEVFGAIDKIPELIQQKEFLAEEAHTLIHQIKVTRKKNKSDSKAPIGFLEIKSLDHNHYIYASDLTFKVDTPNKIVTSAAFERLVEGITNSARIIKKHYPEEVRKEENIDNVLFENVLFDKLDQTSCVLKKCYTKFIPRYIGLIGIILFLYVVFSNPLASKFVEWVGLAIAGVAFSIFGLYHYLSSQKFKTTSISMRQQTEMLRLYGHLASAGIQPKPSLVILYAFESAEDLLLLQIKRLGELAWWHNEKPDLHSVKLDWIEEQVSFFEDRLSDQKPERNSKKSTLEIIFQRPLYAQKKYQKAIIWLFWTGALLVLLLAVQKWFIAYFSLSNHNSINDISLFIIDCLLLMSGSFALWTELASFDNQASGYRKTQFLFKQLQSRLKDKTLVEELVEDDRQAILLVARYAMDENEGWKTAEQLSDLKNMTTI